MKKSSLASPLFQKIDKTLFGKRKFEIVPLVFLCVGVFGISVFASGKILFDYNQREKKAEIYTVGNVLAAEKENDEENISLEENSGKVLASAGETANAVKKKLVKPKKVVPKIINVPPPRAKTKKVSGLRVCDKKNDRGRESHQGSHPHMDMECCPDPDEWPNPHCYYTPEQLSRMLKPPK